MNTGFLRQQIMIVARAEVGVSEKPLGSNWGPRVAEYLASVGIYQPAYWCMAFVYWVFSTALRGDNRLPVTGYTPVVMNWAHRTKRLVGPQDATPGDLVLYYYPARGRVAHVGILGWMSRAVLGMRFMWTIEGNSDDQGRRNGTKVVRRRRRVTENTFFVRTI